MHKALGLEPGADESLNKPFSPPEPLAHTQSLLRKSRPFQPLAQAQPAQALQIDEQGQRLQIPSKALDLTQHEYLLEQSLVNAAGCILIVLRSSLYAAWGDSRPATADAACQSTDQDAVTGHDGPALLKLTHQRKR